MGKIFGGKKDKKNKKEKKSKKEKKPKAKQHKRMSTEEQINYALRVSLQESQQPSQQADHETTNAPQEDEPVKKTDLNDALAAASRSSSAHQRMTTSEQINLAVQMSLQEQTGSPETVNNQTPSAPSAPSAPNHQRMSTQQAIEVAIQRSLTEMKSKPIGEWTTEDLATWMSGLGADYEDYAEEVRSNELDGPNFLPLELEDYVDIGVRNKYHRQFIWDSFQKLLKSQRDQEPAPSAPPPSAKQDRNSSFSGVASLFSVPDDDEPRGPNENSNLGAQQAIQQLEAAQQRIATLEKSLEGERRRAERAEERLEEERQTRNHLEQELSQVKKQLEAKEEAAAKIKKKEAKKEAAPPPEPEPLNDDVALGFVSFTQEKQVESSIHKRDPSFTGAIGLFDDLNFDTDEEEEEEDQKTNQDPASKLPQTKEQKKAAGRDRHKRDPSFSGELADLFSADDMADMGFGPNAVATDSVQFTQDDMGLTSAAPASATGGLKHKRDPSYSGVRDLFEDDESAEEQEEDIEEQPFNPRAPSKAPNRTRNYRKDVSFGGVQQLFEDEEPDKGYNMKIAAETEEEELRNRIAEYEEKLRGFDALREQYERTEDAVEQLQQELRFQKNLVHKSNDREATMENELKKTRDEAKGAREDLNHRIQQISQGNAGATQIIQTELNRTQQQLGKSEESIDRINKQLRNRDQELDALRNSLTKERTDIKRLSEENKEIQNARQKTLNELEEWKSMNTQNAGSVSQDLVKQRMKSQDLQEQVDKLQSINEKLEANKTELQRSKIDLAIRTCAEIDRLRNYFRECGRDSAEGKVRSQTVG